jgi:hypothetical protein
MAAISMIAASISALIAVRRMADRNNRAIPSADR